MVTDSGNFMGYPAMFLGVPDEHGFVFTQAFQSVGLGLATALGAAVARPDRLTVAALGDGGALMGASELETAVRLGLNDLLIVVYDDEAYGAEVHHFGPHGDSLANVRFPPADIAAIARGYGYAAATVTPPGGPGRRRLLARRPPRPPHAHRRQGHPGQALMVARGGLQGPLTQPDRYPRKTWCPFLPAPSFRFRSCLLASGASRLPGVTSGR